MYELIKIISLPLACICFLSPLIYGYLILKAKQSSSNTQFNKYNIMITKFIKFNCVIIILIFICVALLLFYKK